MTFSENVQVSGIPTIALQVGSQSRSARYVGQPSGQPNTLKFRYDIQAGDTDSTRMPCGARVAAKLRVTWIRAAFEAG